MTIKRGPWPGWSTWDRDANRDLGSGLVALDEMPRHGGPVEPLAEGRLPRLEPAGRACSRCGCQLSRYNRTQVCGPCAVTLRRHPRAAR